MLERLQAAYTNGADTLLEAYLGFTTQSYVHSSLHLSCPEGTIHWVMPKANTDACFPVREVVKAVPYLLGAITVCTGVAYILDRISKKSDKNDS